MSKFDLLTAVQPDTGWYAIVGIKAGSVQQFLVETREEAEETIADFLRQKRNVFFGVAKYIDDSGRKKHHVSGLKSLWADIDCGPGKPYPDQFQGAAALRAFVKATGLPKPIVVNSGRGLHVYWPLTETIQREQWEPLAARLKALGVEHSLQADPTCFEAARILRVPGTYNFKGDEPLEVTVLTEGGAPTTPEAMAALLGTSVPAPRPASPLPPASFSPSTSPLGQMIRDSSDRVFAKIMRQGMGGCRQLISCAQDQATLAEPRWFDALSVAKFCADRDTAIHKLSSAHPDYTPGGTMQKIAHIKGPHSCVSFEGNNPGGCKGCPHQGKITSPIMLGTEVIPAPPEPEEEEAEEEDEAPTYRIPDYPFPYIKAVNGAIWRKGEEGEEGAASSDTMVYPYPLYIVKRMSDPDPEVGAVVLFRHHTARDGIEEFTLPVAKVMDGTELRKALASRYIVAANKKLFDLLVDYVTKSLIAWIDNEKVERMRTQFGWADKHSKFILGDREITATGTFYSPPSKATRALAEHLQPVGDFELWKEVFDLYGRPGMEAHAFAAATAFGAPLLHISGQRGAILNLMHSTSGAGKTTALHMCNSVWGNPARLTSTSEDTFNSKVFKVGLLNNLPMCIDEMTNMTVEHLSALTYMVTHGEGKDRMKSQSNELRSNHTSWQTITLTTANVSFYDKLSAKRHTPEGEMMRIIEIEMPHPKPGTPPIIDTEYGKEMFDKQLMENYGHAGELYIRYVLANYEECIRLYNLMQHKIDTQLKLTQRERFWSAVAAANLTGIYIAIRLGLCSWNLAAIFHYICGLIPSLRGSTLPPPTSDIETVGEFLVQHMDSMLIVDSTVDARTAGSRVSLPVQSNMRTVTVRYEPDTKKLYLLSSAFRHFCNTRGINQREVVKRMQASGVFLGAATKHITKGMRITVPPVHAMEFDTSHPDFIDMDGFAQQAAVSEATAAP